MRTSIYAIATAILLALASCTTDNALENVPSNAIKVSATIGNNSLFTRSNPLGTTDEQKSFNDNDKISITDNDQTAVYTLSGTTWSTTDTPLTWQLEGGEFKAFYPCDGTNTFDEGHIKTDQSTKESLIASDYMRTTYPYTSTPTDYLLPLTMERKTSRVIFKITYEGKYLGQNPTIDSFQIYAPITIPGTGSGTRSTITPYNNNGEYIALVGTTDADNTVNFVKLNVGTTNGTTSTSTDQYVRGIPTLEAGNSYTFNLVVSKDKVYIADVSVNRWTSGNTIPDGTVWEHSKYIKQLVTNQLNGGGTNVSLTLSSELNDDEFSAIRDAINSSGAAPGTVNLTLNGVDQIRAGAFNGVNALKSVQFPDATELDNNAFANCTYLETVNVPNVSRLVYSVFANCTNLKSITLGALSKVIIKDSENNTYLPFTGVNTEQIDLSLSTEQYQMIKSEDGMLYSMGTSLYENSADHLAKSFLDCTFKSVTLH